MVQSCSWLLVALDGRRDRDSKASVCWAMVSVRICWSFNSIDGGFVVLTKWTLAADLLLSVHCNRMSLLYVPNSLSDVHGSSRHTFPIRSSFVSSVRR
jgi:hypothetical protein